MPPAMHIQLYQSAKAKRYLPQFPAVAEAVPAEEADPLSLWYAEVFLMDRKPHILLCNAATKMTVILFRYSKKQQPDLLAEWKKRLRMIGDNHGIDFSPWLDQIKGISHNPKSNRVASGHLTFFSKEFQYLIKSRNHGVYPPDDEIFYNLLLAKMPVSFGRSDKLGYSIDHFSRELLSRGLAF